MISSVLEAFGRNQPSRRLPNSEHQLDDSLQPKRRHPLSSQLLPFRRRPESISVHDVVAGLSTQSWSNPVMLPPIAPTKRNILLSRRTLKRSLSTESIRAEKPVKVLDSPRPATQPIPSSSPSSTQFAHTEGRSIDSKSAPDKTTSLFDTLSSDIELSISEAISSDLRFSSPPEAAVNASWSTDARITSSTENRADIATPSPTVRRRRSGWFSEHVDKDEEMEKVKQMVRRSARPQSFDVDDSEIESVARDIASGRLSHRGSVTTTPSTAGELLRGTKSRGNRDFDFESETRKIDDSSGNFTRGTPQAMAAHRRRNSSSNIRAALMMDGMEESSGVEDHTLEAHTSEQMKKRSLKKSREGLSVSKLESDANGLGGLGISTPEAAGRRLSGRNYQASGLNISIVNGYAGESSCYPAQGGNPTFEENWHFRGDAVARPNSGPGELSSNSDRSKYRIASDSKPGKSQIRRAPSDGSVKYITKSSDQTDCVDSETLAQLQELDRLHSQLKSVISQCSQQLDMAKRDIARHPLWIPRKDVSTQATLSQIDFMIRCLEDAGMVRTAHELITEAGLPSCALGEFRNLPKNLEEKDFSSALALISSVQSSHSKSDTLGTKTQIHLMKAFDDLRYVVSKYSFVRQIELGQTEEARKTLETLLQPHVEREKERGASKKRLTLVSDRRLAWFSDDIQRMHECLQLAVESRDGGSLRDGIAIINQTFGKSWDWHHELKGFWDAAVKVWLRQYESKQKQMPGGDHDEQLSPSDKMNEKPISNDVGDENGQPDKVQRRLSSRTGGDNPPHYAQAVAGWFVDTGLVLKHLRRNEVVMDGVHDREFRLGELPELLSGALQRLETIQSINNAAGVSLAQVFEKLNRSGNQELMEAALAAESEIVGRPMRGESATRNVADQMRKRTTITSHSRDSSIQKAHSGATDSRQIDISRPRSRQGSQRPDSPALYSHSARSKHPSDIFEVSKANDEALRRKSSASSVRSKASIPGIAGETGRVRREAIRAGKRPAYTFEQAAYPTDTDTGSVPSPAAHNGVQELEKLPPASQIPETAEFEMSSICGPLLGHVRTLDVRVIPETGQVIAATAGGDHRSDRRISIWDLRTGGLLCQIKNTTHRPVVTLTFHPTRPELLMTSDMEFDVKLWNLERWITDGQETRFNEAGQSELLRCWKKLHTRVIYRIAFVPGRENHAVSCSADQSLKIWDIDSDDEKVMGRIHTNEPITSFVFCGDSGGKLTLVVSLSYSIRIFSMKTYSLLHTIQLAELRANKTAITTMHTHPTYDNFVLVSCENQIRLMDLSCETTLRVYSAREISEGVRIEGQFSPCGNFVYAGTWDIRAFWSTSAQKSPHRQHHNSTENNTASGPSSNGNGTQTVNMTGSIGTGGQQTKWPIWVGSRDVEATGVYIWRLHSGKLERNEMKLMEEAACAALVSSARAKSATISTAGTTTSTVGGSNPFWGGSSVALAVGDAANEFDPVAVASAARVPISACKWVSDAGEDAMHRKLFICAGLDRTLRIYT
ncbi:hypothetical protein BJ742DRAFT_848322 [Cladochytrium replicatum]|nr:hypothetical protein BJ742DRAFT_848322 [Cladochytrium replicatum]